MTSRKRRSSWLIRGLSIDPLRIGSRTRLRQKDFFTELGKIQWMSWTVVHPATPFGFQSKNSRPSAHHRHGRDRGQIDQSPRATRNPGRPGAAASPSKAQLFLPDGARLFCAVARRAVVQLRLQAGKNRLSRRHRLRNIRLGMRRAHKACFVQSRCKVHPPI